MYVYAFCLDIQCGFDDCTGLHLGDFGIGIAKSAATVSEHWVELLKAVALALYFFNG